MAATIFFISALILLIIATYYYASSENGRAAEANKTAEAALDAVTVLSRQFDKFLSQRTETDKKFLDAITRGQDAIDELYTEIHKRPPQSPPAQKVIVTQEKPLQFQVIYREAKPAQSPPKIMLKKIKKQIEGLSK